MDTKSCPKCGATWIGGQLFWATGKPAKEEDLAGLVCNNLGDDTCINSKRGDISGQTWGARASQIETLSQEFES